MSLRVLQKIVKKSLLLTIIIKHVHVNMSYMSIHYTNVYK